MGKYLLAILAVLVLGMIFAILKNPPDLLLFYAQLAGAVIVIIYSSYKNRKGRQNLRKKR